MTLSLKVLGAGCGNCVVLDQVTRDAMTTPALVSDEQVVLAGRVPTPTALRQNLTTASTHRALGPTPIEGN
jgi:hypothetical protein